MTGNLNIKLRLARPDEANILSDIAFSAKRSNGYNESFMDACRDELAITASDITKGEYWVAETDVIQGFVCLMEGSEQGVGEIHSFFIDPIWQRRGTGNLLWQKVMERATSGSVHSIFLDSDPAAVPFYEGLGFRVIGEVPSGSIVGRMIPRMRLEIA